MSRLPRTRPRPRPGERTRAPPARWIVTALARTAAPMAGAIRFQLDLIRFRGVREVATARRGGRGGRGDGRRRRPRRVGPVLRRAGGGGHQRRGGTLA